MKNFVILIIAFSMISFSAFSQKNPPENVKKEFSKKYSSAQSVKWENEEKNEWENWFHEPGSGGVSPAWRGCQPGSFRLGAERAMIRGARTTAKVSRRLPIIAW